MIYFNFRSLGALTVLRIYRLVAMLSRPVNRDRSAASLIGHDSEPLRPRFLFRSILHAWFQDGFLSDQLLVTEGQGCPSPQQP
jgi:hypothetical protein